MINKQLSDIETKIIADLEIEKVALGKAIINDDFRALLMMEDDSVFYLLKYRKVFEALKICHKDEIRVDVKTVHHHLIQYNLLNKVDADEVLADVMLSHTMQDDDYILSVLRKFRLERELIEVFSEYGQERVDGKLHIDLDKYIKKIMGSYEVYQSGLTKEGLNTAALKGKKYEDIFLGDEFKVYPTGFPSIDKSIFGLMGGQLIIIGARQKKGKSTLAINLADNMGDSLFFGLEMKEKHNLSRIYSRHTKIHALRIFSGRTSAEEREKLNSFINEYDKNIEIIDHIKDIHEILAYCRKRLKQGKFNKVFIDYIQLVRGGIGETKNEKIAYISKALKDLAVEFNIPVIAVSQLSRECEKQNRKPISSDLRDSGALEQDADLILMLHEKDGRTQFYIADSRNTPTGLIAGFRADLQYNRFVDPEQEDPEEIPEGATVEEWDSLKPVNPDYFQN